MKLFAKQARDVDIIITTALIPGKPAPKLILRVCIGYSKPRPCRGWCKSVQPTNLEIAFNRPSLEITLNQDQQHSVL